MTQRGLGTTTSRPRASSANDIPEWLIEQLHDDVAQALWYLTLELSSLSQHLPQDQANLQAQMKLLEGVAQEGYQHLRETMGWAKASDVPCRRLVEVIGERLQSFTQKTGVPVQADVPDACDVAVSPPVAHQVSAILQEALWNAWRHGKADTITVRIEMRRRRVEISIEDDGMGFNPQRPQPEGHYGLATMHKRAQSIKGDLTVGSAPGLGTHVTLSFPVGARDAVSVAGPTP